MNEEKNEAVRIPSLGAGQTGQEENGSVGDSTATGSDSQPSAMQKAADIQKAAASLDAADSAAQSRRGRGRPRKYPLSVTQAGEPDDEDEDLPGGEEEDEGDVGSEPIQPAGAVEEFQDHVQSNRKIRCDEEDGEDFARSSGGLDFAYMYQGMQILGEIVRSQNEAQQQFLKAQTEFSNSVMDRMDTYRMEFAKLQSEVAEKEKNRLRADYLTAQDKADQYSDENRQLRAQLDAAGKKLIRMNARIESMESENESLHRQLDEGLISDDAPDKEYADVPSSGRESIPQSSSGAAQPDGTSEGNSEVMKTDSASPVSAKPGWRERRRQKKLKKARDRFLKTVDGDSRFSKEQLQVIHEAANAGLPPEKLELACSPDMTVEDMKMFFRFLRR